MNPPCNFPICLIINNFLHYLRDGSQRIFQGQGSSPDKQDFSNGNTMYYLGSGFKYFVPSPLFGEDSHFNQYFSDGLKPPTSYSLWCNINPGELLIRCVLLSFSLGWILQGSVEQSYQDPFRSVHFKS